MACRILSVDIRLTTVRRLALVCWTNHRSSSAAVALCEVASSAELGGGSVTAGIDEGGLEVAREAAGLVVAAEEPPAAQVLDRLALWKN